MKSQNLVGWLFYCEKIGDEILPMFLGFFFGFIIHYYVKYRDL